MLKFPEEFEVDRKQLKKMKKDELLAIAEKALDDHDQWHKLVNELQTDHGNKLREIEKDVQKHPGFIALKSQLESNQEQYNTMKETLDETSKTLDQCRAELQRRKPAGRKPLDEAQVDEIHRLRAAGKTVREIAKDVGISKSCVGKYTK